MDSGLDYQTYKHGLYQIFVQSEELAKKIFQSIDYDYSGFLNWNSFLDLMFIIKAKTIKDKIDLFIRVLIHLIFRLLMKMEMENYLQMKYLNFVKYHFQSLLIQMKNF